MVTLAAPDVHHDSVEGSSLEMTAGEAVMVAIGRGTPVAVSRRTTNAPNSALVCPGWIGASPSTGAAGKPAIGNSADPSYTPESTAGPK